MERLTNRNYGEISHTGRIIPYSTHCIGCITKDCDCGIVEDMVKKLADYENLEEQDRLVKLPCKVGDTLYRLVPNLYREYVEIKIAQFVINKNGIYFITNKGVSWSIDKIGKTVFLTKSEAEAKLKELRGNQNGKV